MCGRTQLLLPFKDLVALYRLQPVEGFQPPRPRYNLPPTDPMLIVRDVDGARVPAMVRWGLIPSWSKDAKGAPLINARAETAPEKPAFRDAWKRRRCLVPATGFYEWRKEGKERWPVLFRAKGGPLTFAGLWERWRGPDGIVESCTILTTESNELIRPLHDRMPVVLPADAWDLWLAADAPLPALTDLMRPFAAERMEAVVVSRRLNSVANDDAECLTPP